MINEVDLDAVFGAAAHNAKISPIEVLINQIKSLAQNDPEIKARVEKDNYNKAMNEFFIEDGC